MDLAFECELVDDRADIVDDDVAQYPRGTGFGIDLDLADMAAIGEVRDLGRETRDLVEPGLEPLRQPLRHIGSRSRLL
jgi:hypothetical protein